MSAETWFTVMSVLLLLILITTVVTSFSMMGWTKAIDQVINESNEKKQHSHNDIADLIETRQYEQALEAIDKRLATNPKYEALLIWYKGTALYHQKKYLESRLVFLTAIEMDPRYKRDIEPYIEEIDVKLQDDA